MGFGWDGIWNSPNPINMGGKSIDKNPFIGSISCDDRHWSANKLRDVDHVTKRSEERKLYFFKIYNFWDNINPSQTNYQLKETVTILVA